MTPFVNKIANNRNKDDAWNAWYGIELAGLEVCKLVLRNKEPLNSLHEAVVGCIVAEDYNAEKPKYEIKLKCKTWNLNNY